MRIYRSTAFFTVLVLMTIYVSCRKTDSSYKESNNTNVEKFFNSHPSANPIVQGAINFIKRKNDKKNFVNNLVTRSGAAYWDKSVVFENVVIPSSNQGITNDTASVVYVPLVRDGQHFVNTSLLVKMTETDTAFNILYDSDYSSFGFDTTNGAKWNARDVFNVFAKLEGSVFGHTKFRLLDGRIAGDSQHHEKELTLIPEEVNNNNQQGTNLLSSITFCQSWLVCVIPGPSSPALSATNPNSMPGCHRYSYCSTVWVEYESGGGSPGGPTGGNGNGGDGGTGPGGTTGPTGGNGNGGNGGTGPGGTGPTGTGGGNGGGGGGWVPIEDNPPSPEPIDSMLGRYSRAINNKADSIFQLSMNSTNKEEWGFPFVQKNSDIYPKRCTTIHRTNIVILDRYIDAGERIMGELHTHPDPSPNPLDRSAPSGDDLETFNTNSRLNYTLFVECGNVRYALVIENVNLARAYLGVHYTEDLAEEQVALAKQQPNWIGNWQLATEVALKQLLGNSSSCGIGFYKSDAAKLNFTKLN